jgi:hypothetical protein
MKGHVVTEGVMVIVVNTTFNNISVISWGSVYCWRKLEYPGKTTDLLQVTIPQSENTGQMIKKNRYTVKAFNIFQLYQ